MESATVRAQHLGSTLAKTIELVKGSDPMAPALVWAPNAEAARGLARTVAKISGVLNVRFLTGPQIATKLIPPLRQPLAIHRLTSDLKRELTRVVASTARPPLHDGASPLLVQELVRAFDVLRDLSTIELEGAADIGSVQFEIVRLYQQFRQLAAPYYDNADLFEAAADEVNSTTPPVIIAGATLAHPYERFLGDALLRVERLTEISLVEGSDEMSEISQGRIVVAPDPTTEVQVAIGAAIEQASLGVRLPNIALLHNGNAQYTALFQRQLDAANIPWRGRSPLTLAHSVAGRVIGGLAGAISAPLTRDGLVDWLLTGPIRLKGDSSALVPVHEWVQAVKELRATSSIADLSERAQLAGKQQIADFINELVASVPSDGSTWATWAQWAAASCSRYLGDTNVTHAWPEAETQALAKVLDGVRRLARLDDVGAAVDASAFAAALSDELLTEQQRGFVADGVFVGRWVDVVGCSYDAVIVCGLGDGQIDRPPSGLAGSIRLPGADAPSDVSSGALLHVVAAAKTAVLSFSRADTRAGRERRPSPMLLDVASKWASQPVTAGELIHQTLAAPWLHVVPSFSSLLDGEGFLANEQLDQLRMLRQDPGDVDGELKRPFELVAARSSNQLTRFDGNTQTTQLGALSATSLEDWSTCPYRFFLKSVLRIDEGDREADPWLLAANERGRLIHEALEEFLRTAAPLRSPSEQWPDNERQRLHQLVDSKFNAARTTGVAPSGLLLEVELESLHQHLDALLADDEQLRATSQLLPTKAGVEVRFDDVEVERTDGTSVRFRGRIDRVDSSVDGKHMRAYDYKTGKGKKAPDDPLDGGRSLQLAVYSAAVAQQTEGDVEVDAAYWFITDAQNQYPIQQFQWNAQTRARLSEVVTTMTAEIEKGVFPAVPGPEDDRTCKNCRHCPYDSLCPVDRAEAWSRKVADPLVRPFVELAGDDARG